MQNKIPKISSNVEIVPFDNGGYLVHHKELGHRLNINTTTYQLLNLVDGNLNINELVLALKQKYAIEIERNKIIDILYKQLAKYHIIENDEYEYKQKEKPSYLKLSFTVLKKNWIDSIVSKMGFLFSKNIFYTTFFVTLAFILTVIIFNLNILKSDIETINTSKGIIYFIMFVVVIVFHEFGHAAACSKFGANHGDIGFGFYLLSPVMYADVSDAWKLKRSERIIVNLGGIYIQLIIASIFALIYLITKNSFLLIPLFSIGGLSVLYNLNPFFRTDGYWILSDYFGVANLREKSNNSLKAFLKKLIKKGNYVFSLKNVLLAFYALISMSFIFVFIFIILIKNPNSILNYPNNLINYIKLVYRTKVINQGQLQQLLLPTLFFIVLIRYSTKLFKTKVMTLSNTKKKEYFIIAVKIILATVFLLSAVGKTLDYTGFSQKIAKFEIISFKFIPHIILFLEYALAIGFMLSIFIKQVARVAFIFLIFMTISYSFGHFFMNISKCDCFGYFKFLTPSNYFIYLIKNITLILLTVYIFKNTNSSVSRKFLKIVVSVLMVFSLSYLAYRTEEKLISGFAKENEGKAIQDIGFQEYNKLENYQYWFVFSPKCSHCLEAIPKIKKFKSENNLSLVGVTYNKYEEELNKLTIDFPVKKLKSSEISKLTKTVPIIFELKNDTIKSVLSVKMFLEIKKYKKHLVKMEK